MQCTDIIRIVNPWDKTTPVEAALEEKLSSRGYFWIGCAMGVAWTLVMVVVVRFIFDLIA